MLGGSPSSSPMSGQRPLALQEKAPSRSHGRGKSSTGQQGPPNSPHLSQVGGKAAVLHESLSSVSSIPSSPKGHLLPEQQISPGSVPHLAQRPVTVLHATSLPSQRSPGQHFCPSAPQTSHLLASVLQERIWSAGSVGALSEPGHFSPAQQAWLRPPQSSQRPVTVLQT